MPVQLSRRAVPVGFVRRAIVASLVFIPSLTEAVERGASTVKAKSKIQHSNGFTSLPTTSTPRCLGILVTPAFGSSLILDYR